MINIFWLKSHSNSLPANYTYTLIHPDQLFTKVDQRSSVLLYPMMGVLKLNQDLEFPAFLNCSLAVATALGGYCLHIHSFQQMIISIVLSTLLSSCNVVEKDQDFVLTVGIYIFKL